MVNKDNIITGIIFITLIAIIVFLTYPEKTEVDDDIIKYEPPTVLKRLCTEDKIPDEFSDMMYTPIALNDDETECRQELTLEEKKQQCNNSNDHIWLDNQCYRHTITIDYQYSDTTRLILKTSSPKLVEHVQKAGEPFNQHFKYKIDGVEWDTIDAKIMYNVLALVIQHNFEKDKEYPIEIIMSLPQKDPKVIKFVYTVPKPGQRYKCVAGECQPTEESGENTYFNLESCKVSCKEVYQCFPKDKKCSIVANIDPNKKTYTNKDKCGTECCQELDVYNPLESKCMPLIDCSKEIIKEWNGYSNIEYVLPPLEGSRGTQCKEKLTTIEKKKQCDENHALVWLGNTCMEHGIELDVWKTNSSYINAKNRYYEALAKEGKTPHPFSDEIQFLTDFTRWLSESGEQKNLKVYFKSSNWLFRNQLSQYAPEVVEPEPEPEPVVREGPKIETDLYKLLNEITNDINKRINAGEWNDPKGRALITYLRERRVEIAKELIKELEEKVKKDEAEGVEDSMLDFTRRRIESLKKEFIKEDISGASTHVGELVKYEGFDNSKIRNIWAKKGLEYKYRIPEVQPNWTPLETVEVVKEERTYFRFTIPRNIFWIKDGQDYTIEISVTNKVLSHSPFVTIKVDFKIPKTYWKCDPEKNKCVPVYTKEDKNTYDAMRACRDACKRWLCDGWGNYREMRVGEHIPENICDKGRCTNFTVKQGAPEHLMKDFYCASHWGCKKGQTSCDYARDDDPTATKSLEECKRRCACNKVMERDPVSGFGYLGELGGDGQCKLGSKQKLCLANKEYMYWWNNNVHRCAKPEATLQFAAYASRAPSNTVYFQLRSPTMMEYFNMYPARISPDVPKYFLCEVVDGDKTYSVTPSLVTKSTAAGKDIIAINIPRNIGPIVLKEDTDYIFRVKFNSHFYGITDPNSKFLDLKSVEIGFLIEPEPVKYHCDGYGNCSEVKKSTHPVKWNVARETMEECKQNCYQRHMCDLDTGKCRLVYNTMPHEEITMEDCQKSCCIKGQKYNPLQNKCMPPANCYNQYIFGANGFRYRKMDLPGSNYTQCKDTLTDAEKKQQCGRNTIFFGGDCQFINLRLDEGEFSRGWLRFFTELPFTYVRNKRVRYEIRNIRRGSSWSGTITARDSRNGKLYIRITDWRPMSEMYGHDGYEVRLWIDNDGPKIFNFTAPDNPKGPSDDDQEDPFGGCPPPWGC